jgi:hypothetical protein
MSADTTAPEGVTPPARAFRIIVPDKDRFFAALEALPEEPGVLAVGSLSDPLAEEPSNAR